MKTIFKKNGGFTLVELIVVIAILAILAAVAIPAYSGYIEKANKSNDMNLVREVTNALVLHSYSGTGANGGYVILSTEGAKADNAFGAAAMEAVFGTNWTTAAKLSYGDWSTGGVFASINSMSKEDLELISKSPFMSQSTPSDVVKSFTALTDGLSGMAATAGSDPLVTLTNLQLLNPSLITEIEKELEKEKLSWDTKEGADNSAYSTALSNLLIKHVSKDAGKLDLEADPDMENISGLANLAYIYSAVYAGAASGSEECEEYIANLEALIANPNTTSNDIVAAFDADLLPSDFDTYFVEDNVNSFNILMNSVGDLSDGFDMTATGLYSSDSVTGLVDNYFGTVGAVNNMGISLEEGEVAIVIAPSGEITVLPADANPAA